VHYSRLKGTAIILWELRAGLRAQGIAALALEQLKRRVAVVLQNKTLKTKLNSCVFSARPIYHIVIGFEAGLERQLVTGLID